MESVHGLVTFPSSASGSPRSRRMGGILRPTSFPPPRLEDQKPITPPVTPKDDSLSMSPPPRASSPPIPPPPPPRSPLRPSPPKSVSSFATFIDLYARRDTMATLRTSNFESTVNRRRSVASLTTALEQLALSTPVMPPTPASELLACDTFALTDEKPLPMPPEDEYVSGSPTETIGLNSILSEASTDATLAPSAPTITKREHALKELLASEQSYASDLAFIQNVHIPLALGKQAPFQLPTPPSSSSSSSRTLSTSSGSSSSSNHCGPPMTKDDVRAIFGNITELAMFSESFSERLEEALGDVVEGGKGEDWVGALFLEIIPQMEPPYMHYITKHPNAIKHLESLARTPALENYLTQTRNLASSVTHAWDLPSLLIKPVQRLLKYPLLLSTIIDNTLNDHSDKENLRKARDRMQELAHKVNEGRRRMEVVKEVLAGKADTTKSTSLQKKLSIGKTTQVGVGRMKSIGMGTHPRAPRGQNGHNNEEAARVAEQEAQLRKCETFVREFAKNIVAWAHTVRASHKHLKEWADGFKKTIGISDEHPSDAFNAFIEVIDTRLVGLCQSLDDVITKDLLPALARLLDSTKAPLRLLSVMHSLEPAHDALLNFSYSKHRPTPTMLDASQKYLAIRGQLASDLPKYLELFDQGVVICIRRLAYWQTEFWSLVRNEWSTLWECLRMEGETNGGCEETLTLWWARYSEVEESISKLKIVMRDKPFPRNSTSRMRGQSFDAISMDSAIYMSPLPDSTSSTFSGLSSGRHPSFGSLDSTISRSLRTSPSIESVPTLSSYSRSKSRPRTPDSVGRLKARSNTNPLPSSSSQYFFNPYMTYPSHGTSVREYAESIDSRSDIRGRKSRSSSLSRRLSETLRTPLRRSPSQKSIISQRSQRSIPPGTTPSFLVPDPDNDFVPPVPREVLPPPQTPPAYHIVVVHPCTPPDGASYMDLPFFKLREGEIYGVLAELGHPSLYEGLCMDIEEGEDDCLLVLRNDSGEAGLALASFLVPASKFASVTAV